MEFFKKILVLAILLNFSIYAEEKFVVITPEKTGTHLLTKMIERLVNKETRNCWAHSLTQKELMSELQAAKEGNAFLQIHALPTPVIIMTLLANKYKVIFLIRDPRDVVVSLLFYIDKGWAYGPYRTNSPYGILSFDDKLYELISGEHFGMSVPLDLMGRRMLWLYQDEDFVYTARFENLVGPNGGGTLESQMNEITQIANHLGITLEEGVLSSIIDNLFGTADMEKKGTFREGTINSWKKYYTDRHRLAFKKVFGKELIMLNYEKDNSW